MPIDEKQLKEYEQWGVEGPTSVDHGMTPEELAAKMDRAQCSNWRLEGNQLFCDTQFGPLSQTIDPGYILIGEKDGLPVFKKIAI